MGGFAIFANPRSARRANDQPQLRSRFRIELHQKDLNLALQWAQGPAVSLPNTATARNCSTPVQPTGGPPGTTPVWSERWRSCPTMPSEARTNPVRRAGEVARMLLIARNRADLASEKIRAGREAERWHNSRKAGASGRSRLEVPIRPGRRRPPAGHRIGVLWPDFAEALKPLGDGFIKLIKMVVAPIVFGVVVLGIAARPRPQEGGPGRRQGRWSTSRSSRGSPWCSA